MPIDSSRRPGFPKTPSPQHRSLDAVSITRLSTFRHGRAYLRLALASHQNTASSRRRYDVAASRASSEQLVAEVSRYYAPQLRPRCAIWLGAQQSMSPRDAAAVNDDHSAAVKVSAGPERCFESRTPTVPSDRKATSTQFSEAPLWMLLNHCAVDKSSITTRTPSPSAGAGNGWRQRPTHSVEDLRRPYGSAEQWSVSQDTSPR